MPANTPRGYPYPLYTDPANFPAQIQAFATAVDTDVQAQVNAINGALSAPSCRVSATANQAIAVNTDTTVTWATEEFDNAAMGNLGVNNDRITFTSTGIYLVHVEINFTSNSNATVGGRWANLFTGGATSLSRQTLRGAQNQDTELAMTYLHQCTSVAQFIRVQVRQDSGAALNISARSFSATKVSA